MSNRDSTEDSIVSQKSGSDTLRSEPSYVEVVSGIRSVLEDAEPVSLTESDIAECMSMDHGTIRHYLQGMESWGIVKEKNQYWSLCDEGTGLAERNAMELGQRAIEESDWGEYNDENLNELPDIGEV